ncbi:hypothetical protein LMG2828_00274 [Achromobacter piechaudii]|nr:hypothetical protein LMG2828_00274 [Achromobacter piechaudii]CAB3945882.1 hypothetical protein LMG6103_01417 [Achromobacter piechaudii]
MFKKAGLFVGLALVLAACSPRYNWREVDVADGHVRAAFPDRVSTETRDLRLDTHTLRFTLSSATVGEAVFAVGSAPLPPDIAADPAARQALGMALMQSLYVNMQAPPPTQWPAYGQDIEVHGKAMGKPGWLQAKVWVTDTMLIEAVAAGTQESLPAERAREFLRSVVVNPGKPGSAPANAGAASSVTR